MRRVAFLLAVLVLAGGAVFAIRDAHWGPAAQPDARPATRPSAASSDDAATTAKATGPDEYAGLEPAEAAALARVWLLHGDAAERARARSALARVGATAPDPAAAPALASLSPSAAWEAQAARRRGVEETLDPSVVAHERAIESLRERWAAEIRAALPGFLPVSPEDRLSLARLADAAGDRAALAAALARLANDTGESGRVAATWLVSVRLDEGDVEGASAALVRVRDEFGGAGLDSRGRTIPASLLADALVERAAEIARGLVEGASPDAARAKRSLDVAREFAADGTESLDAAARYVAAGDHPLDLDAVATGLPRVDGPRVIALTDDFQLGARSDSVLVSVLRRWSRGLPVSLVGRLTGKKRVGIRRVPVASEADERATLSMRAKAATLSVDGIVAAGGPEERRLGLASDVGAVVFVLDRDHRVVGRVSGQGLDPRPLDAVVSRLVPDPAVIAPPPGSER